jgi:hypothetical protein
MTARWSALRTGRALHPRNIIFRFWYLFLLEAEWTSGPSKPSNICIYYTDAVSFLRGGNSLLKDFT